MTDGPDFIDRIRRRARQFPELTTETGAVNGSALARKADLTQQTVSKLLTGETQNPRLETMQAVARALEAGLDELFGDRCLTDSEDFRRGVRYATDRMEKRLGELREENLKDRTSEGSQG